MSASKQQVLNFHEGAKAANAGNVKINNQNIYQTLDSNGYKPKKSSISMIPPNLLDDEYIGHEKLLKEVSACVQDHRKVAIYGLGGIGKSKLAAQVANALYPKVFNCVFWINATNITTFMSDMQCIASELNLQLKHDPSSIAHNVKTWMEDLENDSWLIVLDGASEQAVSNAKCNSFDTIERNFVQRLPRRLDSPLRTILITTCEKVVAQKWTRDALFEVPFLEQEAAIRLLSSASGPHPAESSDVKILVEELDRNPSAILSAADSIQFHREAGGTVSSYLQRFRKLKDESVTLLDGSDPSISTLDGSTQNIIATWRVKIGAVQTRSKDAEDLLCFLACFDGTKIPTSLFRHPFDWKETYFQTQKAILLDYRLIRPNGTEGDFTMPRLVRKTIRKWVRSQHQEPDSSSPLMRWHLKALLALLNAYDEMRPAEGQSTVEAQLRRRTLLPHVEIFRQFCRIERKGTRLEEDHLRAIVLFAELFSSEGSYSSAEDILGFAKDCESECSYWHKKAQLRLATCLRDQSLVDGKECRLDQALFMTNKVKDAPGEVDDIELWSTLAIIQTDRNSFKKAAHYQNKIVHEMVKLFGQNGLQSLDARLDLSIIYYREGSQEKALAEQRYIERVLHQEANLSDPDHASRLLQVQAALVRTYYSLGRMEAATLLARQVVAGRTELLGELDMKTIGSEKDLAQCLRALDKQREAVDVLNATQQKLQQKFGIDHAEVLRCIERVDSMRRDSAAVVDVAN